MGGHADQMTSLLATGSSGSIVFRKLTQAPARSVALPGDCVHLGLPSLRPCGERLPSGARSNTQATGLADEVQSSKPLSTTELRRATVRLPAASPRAFRRSASANVRR
jgi:hypothetical protein